MVTFLKWNFFVYRDLWQWLSQHFTKLLNLESLHPDFSFQDSVFSNREGCF